MVENDNKGIRMSTTITGVNKVSHGSIISFGIEDIIGNDANNQIIGLPGEYMVFCMAVDRNELEKTRKIMESENKEE